MSLNHTPSANRIHIGFFGRRNAGKSSVVNAVTGQNLAIVSDIKGTTTDPVSKAMEFLPLGPVMIIDTPGLDDEGELGELRVQKSYQVLDKTDIAVLVVDATIGRTAYDEAIIESFQQKNIPYLVVYNKLDLCSNQHSALPNEIWVSAETRENIAELKELIAKQVPQDIAKYPIVSDLILPMDFVVLVVPIDSAAPKGRLILPQQQTIREVLEAGAAAIAVKETELQHTLNSLGKKPKLVITDSQAFKQVSEVTPKDILLTSFSILFARHKGSLEQAVMGAKAVDSLCDGDAVLISEGCTHHRQCEDIGTVKLPKWITDYTRKALKFEFTSGTEFPKDLQKYKLVIHCGGCMLNEREMKYRLQCAEYQNVPITNYGILIAYIHGILQRSIEVFPNISALL